jgi:hypothetical protein
MYLNVFIYAKNNIDFILLIAIINTAEIKNHGNVAMISFMQLACVRIVISTIIIKERDKIRIRTKFNPFNSKFKKVSYKTTNLTSMINRKMKRKLIKERMKKKKRKTSILVLDTYKHQININAIYINTKQIGKLYNIRKHIIF